MVSARSVAGADDMADGIPASGLLDALASDFEGALQEWEEIRDLLLEALEMEPSEDTPEGHA